MKTEKEGKKELVSKKTLFLFFVFFSLVVFCIIYIVAQLMKNNDL